MLDIVFTLYSKNIERLAYFITTYEALRRKGYFGDHPVKFHVCIEFGSLFMETLKEYCTREKIEMHFKSPPQGLAGRCAR